jgi:hypothetical protein
MPRVVPSQVVRFIDSIPLPELNGIVRMNKVDPAMLSGLLNLVEQVPEELLTMDGDSYAYFIYGKAQIKEILATWTSNRNAGHDPAVYQFSSSRNPLAMIRDAFTKCHDESPSPSTSELGFITDNELRTNLRNDVGGVNRALADGEWKAATILAGSVIEALLLWDLQNRRQTIFPAAVSALVANKTFDKQPPGDPEEWSLHHYVEVEAHLGVIKPDTVTEARLAKKFRNLIHPGRAQRLGQKHDRGTALSSVAALEHVVRDLTP